MACATDGRSVIAHNDDAPADGADVPNITTGGATGATITSGTTGPAYMNRTDVNTGKSFKFRNLF